MIVNLAHGFIFRDMKSIQADLADIAKLLAPPQCKTKNIEFLTNGDVSQRILVYQSGNIMIEDVKEDDHYLRQLIFTSNINQIQSEIRLKYNGDIRDGISTIERGMLEGDYQFLTCEWLKVMLLAFVLNTDILDTERSSNVLILGAGGGVFPTFIAINFENSNVSAVDIDNSLIEIGQRFFSIDPKINIHIEDALVYVDSLQDSKFDYIFLDICIGNSEIPTPPPQFTDPQFLLKVKNSLSENGVLSINTFGNSDQKRIIYSQILTVFDGVLKVKCVVDSNEIIFCTRSVLTTERVELGSVALSDKKDWDISMGLGDYKKQLH